MTKTQSTITRVGLVTVKGRERMAFIREGEVFYFASLSSRKALRATADEAATWEYVNAAATTPAN